MKKIKKLVAIISTIILSTTLFAGCGNSSKAGENGTINVFNVGDYIDEDLIGKFEKETGIKVNYDVYDTNETMYEKVKNNPGQYDIVVPSDYMIERMIKEDLLETIDYSNIPNYENIDSSYKNLSYDPENKYSVPYMWGTIGILYDADKVQGDITSWADLWDLKYKDNIFMFDSLRDTLAIGLKKSGFSMNSTNIDELQKAKAELIKQLDKNGLNTKLVGDEGKQLMISGERAIDTAWSGDAIYIMNEAPDTNFKYVIPKEGSNKWFDGMCIPKGAPNKAGAEAFINFLNNPENAKQNVEYIGYSTPNKAAFDLLDEKTKSNPAAYPSKEDLDRCEVFTDLGDKVKLYGDIWTEIKAAAQ